jgi:putative chitinase
MPDLDLGHTRLIMATASRHGATVEQTAYLLATALWETNRTMQPVEEAYFLGSRAEAYRRRLRYHPWHGRGFAQLTWEDNYIRAGREIGIDLTADPDRAMDPRIAAEVLVRGSLAGWFTGKRLGDFIAPGQRPDYLNARRVINGKDRAAEIAAIALDYEHVLTPEPDYPAIRRGSRGAAVLQAQNLLTAHGYDTRGIDGVFGDHTHRAARHFQQAEGLTVDGIIGPLTWAALIPDSEGE